jgi:nitrite reductase (NO-forming)
VHRQARVTFAVAVTFVVAAALTAVMGQGERWLALHLFLIGGLLSAISAATQVLAVTWAAAPAPTDVVATVQRTLLAGGAVVLVIGRRMDAPKWVSGLGAAGILAALVLLVVILVRIRAGAVNTRFHAAIDAYLVAIAFGIIGSGAGALMAVDAVSPDTARSTHVVLNLFGLVGLVIAGTLPYFGATQLRTRQTGRATPAAVRGVVGWLALAAATAAAGALASTPNVTAAGLAGYAAGVVAIAALVPVPESKQLRWGGPRLAQLGGGFVWWVVTTALLVAGELGGGPDESRVLVALVVGGYAQILAGSLAYFGPVLRGGGHVRLAEGFALTRSWPAVIAANVAATAALFAQYFVLGIALLAWIGDALWRAIRLARPGSASRV